MGGKIPFAATHFVSLSLRSARQVRACFCYVQFLQCHDDIKLIILFISNLPPAPAVQCRYPFTGACTCSYPSLHPRQLTFKCKYTAKTADPFALPTTFLHPQDVSCVYYSGSGVLIHNLQLPLSPYLICYLPLHSGG